MKLERFVRTRAGSWNELDELTRASGRLGRARRLGAAQVCRLGDLYRSTAADLAFARRAYPGEPLVEALELRVRRSRALVYQAPTRRGSIVQFFARDYWRAVRERPLPLLLAFAILVGSVGLSAIWADRDPGAAAGFASGSYQAVTQPRPHGSNLELPRSTRAALATAIFTNNIRVTLLVLAAGVLAGIGSAIVLAWNGVLLGVVGGLAVGSGNGRVFFELVSAHGMLELSCTVVATAAGMRLGWAFVSPGQKSRAQSMRDEAHETIAIVIGTAPWLVVAGLVEGFITPSGIGLTEALAIGASLAAVYWSLVLLLGRARVTAEPAPSP